MKIKKILMIAPVTNEFEDKTKSIVHHGNMGDILIVHEVRKYIQEINPFSEISIWPSSKVIDESLIEYINNTFDLLIFPGGGILHECPMARSRFLFNCRMQDYTKIKIPIIVNSIGYNVNIGDQDLSSETWKNIETFLNHAALVSVRDNYTAEKINQMCNSRHIHVVHDPVLFMDRFARDKNCFEVGVIVSKPLEDQFIKIIKTINEGNKIKLIHHIPNSCWQFSGKSIIEKCPERRIINSEFSTNIDALKELYRGCSLVIGANYHAMIIAASQEIPFINFAYNYKNEAFLNDFGYSSFVKKSDFCKDKFDIEKIIQIPSVNISRNDYSEYFNLFKDFIC